MKKKWQLFVLIEALLLVWLLYESVSNSFTLLTFIIGVVVLLRSKHKKNNSKRQNYLMIGSILILIALLSTSAVWFMLICAILFFVVLGNKSLLNFRFSNFEAPWQDKDIIIVETAKSLPKNGKRFKRSWFGNERIGNAVYEWDDINLTVFMGDTIVDLGNTLLPKDESYVIIRKGFGKTRILVPTGIGIMIEHSAFKGKVFFESDIFVLSNESVKLYSEQYDENTRKIKLITTVLVGDLEVITI
ncbi:cell wall-active antibiotics response protein LiaF [Carnobacterium funditum]|uniref:cell wall-active antibiotics response protein LiaF n=1 Tax=Carnobacterium funditum TaxID=2752 RepID=UPI0005587735|nr:cell wall-active antibiotics response protein LiaF [Carnobacterium funditum]